LKEILLIRLYIIGMINRVKKVQTIKPPSITTPIGDLISEPEDLDTAIGITPRIVVKAVSKTGRNLVTAPSITALLFSTPLLIS